MPVLVDSAAGFGSTDEDGAELGTQGDAEVFSFHATKPLAIGEGGAISARDDGLIARIRQLTSFGLDEDRSLPAAPGLNARMSEPHAAIGLAALDRYDEVLSARRQRAATLTERLGQQLEFQPGSAASTWQFVPALAPTRQSRNAILAHARDKKIEMRAYHQPLHLFPTLSHYPTAGSLEVTEYLASRVLSLPMANDISNDELDEICACVMEAEG